MKRFIFTVIVITLLSMFIFEPFLEHITGVSEEIFNFVWWIDVFMLVTISFPIHFIYDKYIEKWIR